MVFENIVPILQTGLAGFSFLLAFLSYRVIAREQQKEAPRVVVLKSAHRYFYLCIVLAVVVGSFELAPIMLRKERATPEHHIKEAIKDHIAKCGQIFERLNLDQEQLAECRDSFVLLASRAERAQ